MPIAVPPQSLDVTAGQTVQMAAYTEGYTVISFSASSSGIVTLQQLTGDAAFVNVACSDDNGNRYAAGVQITVTAGMKLYLTSPGASQFQVTNVSGTFTMKFFPGRTELVPFVSADFNRSAVFYPSASETAIRAAFDSAKTAGGGTIYLPDATISLAASLPMASGINYIGVPVRVTHTGQIPDDTFLMTGGTILTGNGKFPAFRPGLNDSLTYWDDSPVKFATLNTSTDRATFEYDPNWQTGVVVTVQTTGNGFTAATTMYLYRVSANLYEFYTTRAHAIAGSGASKVDVTGTVVATNGNVSPIQVTTCNATPSSQTAYTTTTNNTTSVVVAGGGAGVDFVVGQGVVFSGTANGTLTIGRTYYILSISTNTITIGATPGGSAITVGTGNPGMTPWLSNEVSNCEIAHIGFGGSAATGFTRAISCGAKNQIGPTFCHFHDLWIDSCVGASNVHDPDRWGLYLANFHHTTVTDVRFQNCANIAWFSSSVNSGTLQCGNSEHDRLVAMNNSMSAADKRRQRGFCYIGEYDGFLNEVKGTRIQSTAAFNRTQLSETPTLAASTSIPVADSSLYSVGQPIVFGTTRGSITAGLIYFVLSIVDATHITVGATRGGAAVAGGVGTSNIKTWGFPSMELYGDRVKGGATTSKVTNADFDQLDLEGDTTGQLYLENCISSQFHIGQLGNGNATVHPHLVLRNAQPNYVYNNSVNLISDIDDNSIASTVEGLRDLSLSVQNIGTGFFKNAGSGCFEFQYGSQGVTGRGGFQSRAPSGGSVLIPRVPLGAYIGGVNPNKTYTLNAGQFSDAFVYTGDADTVLTLPSLTTDAGTSANASFTNIRGRFYNNTAFLLTLRAQGTQYIDGKASVTDIIVPAMSGEVMHYVELMGAHDGSGATGFYWSVVDSSFRQSYTLFLSAVTNDTTFSVPAGYAIQQISIRNTTANAITGGIKIGTTSGGTEVLAALPVGASGFVSNNGSSAASTDFLRRYFSDSAATTLYLQDVTNWNSASINVGVTLVKAL